MSNFEFLTQEAIFKSFAGACVEAEKTLATSPALCALGARKAFELAVKWVYAIDSSLAKPCCDNLSSLIRERSFETSLFKTAPELSEKLRYVVKVGNLAAHTGRQVSRADAVASLACLFAFVVRLDYRYGEHYRPRQFEASTLPNGTPDASGTFGAIPKSIKKQVETLVASLDEKNATIQKLQEKLVASFAEKNETIEALQKELETFRAEREKSVEFVAEIDPNEAETRRRYIDVELKLRGWTFGPDGDVGVEVELDAMATPTGKGRADYVLRGRDGKPLAVVEAKRTTRDPNVGREQAKRYADALEKQYGRRPLIFYSNGFETYFWDDRNAPPRRVGGFFTADELTRIVLRREAVRPLASVEIPPVFNSRPYQKAAVRAVCDAIEKGKRKHLLAMATGTGKTRTVGALVETLILANRVSNVLFLADRRELVSQAKDSFAATSVDLSLCNLLTNKEDAATARVVFSTYPTILNAIDDARADGDGVAFSPGKFDLIIVDEAHRSIYKKYGAIFEYFDAIVVGLTATPKDEVDRNTFDFFETERGVPTYAYPYEDAIAAKFLVPYRNVEITTKILENGIVYDELSAEEKERYEELFGSGESDESESDADAAPTSADLPNRIDADAVNEYVFNGPTVDSMLQELTRNGVRTSGGDRIGKTIVFAKNKRSAQFIVERFDKLYPQYNGEFARRIVCGETGVERLISDFKQPDKPPFIAVTVDMLETGVDVPDCVNLVFFKRIRSKTKFWQALGRGTRRSDRLECVDALDGEYVGKRRFYVFDYLQNFEFFRQRKEGVKGRDVRSLTEKIFARRVRLIAALQRAEYAADDYRTWRAELIAETLEQTRALNPALTAVALRRKYVEKYRDENAFAALDETSERELTQELAPLVFSLETNEGAKRFDALLYGAALAAIESNNVAPFRRSLAATCDALEKKTSIPQIAAKLETIRFAKSAELWDGRDPAAFERVRRELRDLCQFLDDGAGAVRLVFSDFDDDALSRVEGAAFDSAAFDCDEYCRRAERYVAEHQDDEPIYRLRNNLPLAKSDWDELERIFENELGSRDEARQARDGKTLGRFVREIAKMERPAVEKAFADFIDFARLSGEQIAFVQRVVDYVVENGFVELNDLVKTPFDKPNKLQNLFSDDEKASIRRAVERLNENARAAA